MVLKVNKIMDQFIQRSFFRFRPCGQWQPAVNFYETDTGYQICVDLAGVDPKQVELQAENDVLHIVGHRATPSPAHGVSARIHIMEIDHGPFCRTIKIPDGVDIGKIQARYYQGFLWVDLPRAL